MPVEWAKTMMNLAIAYSDRIRGDRAENLEQAIEGYQQALQVMTRQAMPVEWAQTMMNLAIAYSDRIRGDRAENLERHRRLPASLAGDDPPGHARRVGANHEEPGERLLWPHPRRPGGKTRARHRGLRAGLAGEDPPGHARRVGATMMNLAIAYSDRIRGDRAENIERAIAGYEQALQVMTRQAMPVEWAQP